ncbi:MAG: hypothetical protein U1D55_00640 [Phycisphaerae bacterium]
MTRKFLFVALLVGVVQLGGCPTTVDTGTRPPGDPTTNVGTTQGLSISASSSILQFSQQQFLKTATLTAIATGISSPTVTWTITSPTTGGVIAFIVNGAQAATATGTSVTIQAISAPSAAINHTVHAEAVASDGTTFAQDIQIRVVQDQVFTASSTFVANPFPTPAFGVNSSSQVVLDAGISGQSGAAGLVQFTWSTLPGASYTGVTPPAALNTQQITLNVAPGTNGVFPFTVVATDVDNNVTTGFVDVFLGVTSVALDVRSSNNAVLPGGAVTLTFDQNGGVPPYQYTFSATGGSLGSASPLNAQPGDATVTWTAPGTEGTQRIDVTIIDSAGASFTDSVTIAVSTKALALDARASSSLLTPGGSMTVTLDVTNGGPNYSYAFSASGPGGGGSFGASSPISGQAGDATVSWTAPAVDGPYEFRATVTDALGNTATDTFWVFVSATGSMALDVRSNNYLVRPGGTVGLTFDVTGGQPNYSYAFSASGPAGAGTFGPVSPLSGQAGDAAVNWTAPSGSSDGAYLIAVTVTDAGGHTTTDSIAVSVSSNAGMVVELQTDGVSSNTINPGDTIGLNFGIIGGRPNYTYTYAALGPGGAGTFAPASGALAPQAGGVAGAVTWTAPSGSVDGGYRLVLTATDSLGNTATDSMWVYVTTTGGMSLVVRAADNGQVLAPSGSTTLTFDISGGIGPYTYTYSTSAGSFGAASPQVAATDFSTSWTAPATLDTARRDYLVTVFVQDSVGNIANGSIVMIVEVPPLVLDVQTAAGNFNVINPGDTVNLTLSVTGGQANYSYVYAAQGPGGSGTFLPVSPLTGQAGSGSIAWTAPTGAVDGGYRIVATATDSIGNTSVDSIWIYVTTTGGMTLDVRASSYVVAPGGTSTLTLDVTGGLANYSYSLSASGGALSSTLLVGQTGDVSAGAGLTWTAPAAAPGIDIGYQINVTVTDADGNSATDSLWLVVAADPLSLDVRATRQQLSLGGAETTTLTFDVTGGAPNYSYAFAGFDQTGAAIAVGVPPNDYFSAASPQGGQAGDLATVTFDPLGGTAADLATGFYTIRVTVTDALGNTFTDSIVIEVIP